MFVVSLTAVRMLVMNIPADLKWKNGYFVSGRAKILIKIYGEKY